MPAGRLATVATLIGMRRRLFLVLRFVPASVRRECSFRAGDYVTDGKRLLVVRSPLTPRSPDGVIELEDRSTLERLLYTGREAWQLWLRKVADELPDESWLLSAGRELERLTV